MADGGQVVAAPVRRGVVHLIANSAADALDGLDDNIKRPRQCDFIVEGGHDEPLPVWVRNANGVNDIRLGGLAVSPDVVVPPWVTPNRVDDVSQICPPRFRHLEGFRVTDTLVRRVLGFQRVLPIHVDAFTVAVIPLSTVAVKTAVSHHAAERMPVCWHLNAVRLRMAVAVLIPRRKCVVHLPRVPS
jgi:hypothetical protein